MRLAPLYDLASILPYDKFDMRKIKLSMKIGGEYRLVDVGLRQWRKLAGEVRIDEGRLIDRILQMAARLPDEAATERNQARKEGLRLPIIDRLTEGVTERAVTCQKIMTVA